MQWNPDSSALGKIACYSTKLLFETLLEAKLFAKPDLILILKCCLLRCFLPRYHTRCGAKAYTANVLHNFLISKFALYIQLDVNWWISLIVIVIYLMYTYKVRSFYNNDLCPQETDTTPTKPSLSLGSSIAYFPKGFSLERSSTK